jgi:predicted alpha/beta-hydrolase family hydrolase
MGPFALNVAIASQPIDQVKALILLSHGIGGSELAHSALAQSLARNGYLVAALRHPGDNWQDRSLLERSPSATSTSGRGKPVESSIRFWPIQSGRIELRVAARDPAWVR